MNENFRFNPEKKEELSKRTETLEQTIEQLKQEGAAEFVAAQQMVSRNFEKQFKKGQEKQKSKKQLLILECSNINQLLGQLTVLTDKRLDSSNTEIVDVVNQTDSLPVSLDHVGGIVITGSPSDIVDKEQKPWIGETESFVQKALDKNIPVMGICFGIQLHADLKGREVSKNEGGREMGVWKTSVYMNAEEAQHPVFKGIDFQKSPDGKQVSKLIETLGSHAYRVDPTGPEKMYGYHYTEEGNGYPMLEVDGSFIGTQFHPELSTSEGLSVLKSLVKSRAEKLKDDGKDPNSILREVESYEERIMGNSGNVDNSAFLKNFISIVFKE